MFLYSSAVLKRYSTRLALQSRLGDNYLELESVMRFCTAVVLKRHLPRLALHSRLGDILLGIRVIYMFLYLSLIHI